MITREYSNGAKLVIMTEKSLYVKAWEINLGFGTDAPSMSLTCARHEEDTILEVGTELTMQLEMSDKSSVSFVGYVYSAELGADFVYNLLLRKAEYFTRNGENSYGSVALGIEAWEVIDSKATPVKSSTVNMFSENPYNFVNRIAACYGENTVYGRGLNKIYFRSADSLPDITPDPQHWIIEGGISVELNKHDTPITATRVGKFSAYSLKSGSSVVALSDYSAMAKAVLSNHKFDVPSKSIVLGSHALIDIAPGMIVDLTKMNYKNSSQFPKRGFVSQVKISAEDMGCELSVEIREL